jgi:hypothetical protein
MSGHSSSTQLANFDVLNADNKARRDAQTSCDALLRAQLRAGQHLLPLALARAVGATLFMEPGTVRAANNDPTITEGARA